MYKALGNIIYKLEVINRDVLKELDNFMKVQKFPVLRSNRGLSTIVPFT